MGTRTSSTYCELCLLCASGTLTWVVPWGRAPQLLSPSHLPTGPWFCLGSNVPRSRKEIKSDPSQFCLFVLFCQWLAYTKGPGTCAADETWWEVSWGEVFSCEGRDREVPFCLPPLPSALDIVVAACDGKIILLLLCTCWPHWEGRPEIKRVWVHEETIGPNPSWNHLSWQCW